jgi:aminoglycoside phosphotransferase (APT) family kinase protein
MMSAAPMPAAELYVSPALVRELLTAQQPDLAGLPLELMANGWDNVLYRVGEVLVARLPRREVAAGLLVSEQRWLPVLAPRLPLPIPEPVRTGVAGPGYPWAWSIVPFMPGRAAAQNPPAHWRDAAISLGRFLAALHTPAPPDAPVNVLRGVPLADRSARLAQHLSAVSGLADHRAVLARWQAALAVPAWDQSPVWLHGDLHPANIVVHRGRISGVIDFGDITSGDPATDLSAAWMLLPAGYHDEFRAAYQGAGEHAASDDTWARARGWALALALAMLANSADNPGMAGIGQRTLAAVLA